MESFLNWITANQQIIYIVILMIFVGIEVIGRVPSVLHTPLMSGANAIHGVVIIGAIIVMGKAEDDNYLALVLGFLAVVLGTLNVEFDHLNLLCCQVPDHCANSNATKDPSIVMKFRTILFIQENSSENGDSHSPCGDEVTLTSTRRI